MKLNTSDIHYLLTQDENMKIGISTFHYRLSEYNQARDESHNRTLSEKATDALGRLLTGDEVCAAVAIDGEKILVATNASNHCRDKIEMQIMTGTLLSGSTQQALKLKLVFQLKHSDKTVYHTSVVTYTPRHRSNAEAIDQHYHLATLFEAAEEIITIEIPYTGSPEAHEIDAFPYPISIHLSPYKHLQIKI